MEAELKIYERELLEPKIKKLSRNDSSYSKYEGIKNSPTAGSLVLAKRYYYWSEAIILGADVGLSTAAIGQVEENSQSLILPHPKFKISYKELGFNNKATNVNYIIEGNHIAVEETSSLTFEDGQRVIARNPVQFAAGTVIETTSNRNNSQYLVAFDDGRDAYCYHSEMRAICFCRGRDQVHLDVDWGRREFIQNYFASYPCKTTLQLKIGQSVTVLCSGAWVLSTVVNMKASLVELELETKHREWVYKGSHRLWSVYEHFQINKSRPTNSLVRSRGFGTARIQDNVPQLSFRENIGVDEPKDSAGIISNKEEQTYGKVDTEAQYIFQEDFLSCLELQRKEIKPNRKRVVLKLEEQSLDGALEPSVYVEHVCSESCVTWTKCSAKDIDKYYPLVAPLMYGFQRIMKKEVKGKITISYKTPCGVECSETNLNSYLHQTNSVFTPEMFSFDPEIDVLRVVREESAFVKIEDITNKQEKIGISCINEIDSTQPPCLDYFKHRVPSKDVVINLDTNFLVCCDCTDNCQDATKCRCIQLTMEGKQFSELNSVGYQNRRLPEKIMTAIYECNDRCSCSSKCMNRVVQQPISVRLQMFRTQKKGWGLRCLHDLPKGSFICTYQGLLLTDLQATENGKKYGDEYLAELDYIEVAETHKQHYEADVDMTSEDEDEIPEDKTDKNYYSAKKTKPKKSSPSQTWSGRLRKRGSHCSLKSKVKRSLHRQLTRSIGT